MEMSELTLLTVEEVAGMLRMTPSWVYARTGDGALVGTGRGRRKRSGKAGGSPQRPARPPAGRIPHFKAGRLLRFDKAKVLAWWAQHERNGSEAPGTQPGGGQN